MLKYLQYFNKKYEEILDKKIILRKSQIKLIKLLAEGLTLREIAEKIGKSYNNIHKRTINLYKKFRVNSRRALITKAIRLNFISTKDVKFRFKKRFKPKQKENQNTEILDISILSEQEKKFLQLAGQGKTLKEIIQIMNIRTKYDALTIKYIICNKLKSKNITEAVAKFAIWKIY